MTMNGFPLSQSPKTQAMGQQPGSEDEDELFSQGFSDLAYQAFQKTRPELYGDLVSFRVLATDASNGEGIGAFILKRGSEVFFVPAVVADNAVKPLDLMYVRSKDRFYPLTSEWVERALSSSVSSLGQGMSPPKDLNTDVDMRNVVVPPVTGRYSYAEKQAMLRMYQLAAENEKNASDHPAVFPELLSKMPNGVKLAYTKWLGRNPKYLRKIAEVYSAKLLADVLAPTAPKVAAEFYREIPQKHDVYLATATTPVQELKEELSKDDVGMAYKAIRYHGFYIKDRRKGAGNDITAYAEEPLTLVEPEVAGVYRVWGSDGKPLKAIVITDVVCAGPAETDQQITAFGEWNNTELNKVESPFGGPRRFLVCLPDGRAGYLSRLLAEPIVSDSFETVADFLKSMTTDRPSKGDRGFFVSTERLSLRATEPLTAKSVSSDDTVTRTESYDMTYVQSDKLDGTRIIRPPQARTMLLPRSFRWFKESGSDGFSDSLTESDFLTDARQIGTMIEHDMEKTSAERVLVRRSNEGGFYVGGERHHLSSIEAVVKVANLYNVSLPDATSLVEAVANGLKFNAWATPKTAAPAAPPAGGDPSMDPNAAPPGMDPSQMMAPPPPPPPTGMELALQEQMQQLDSQMASLNQMKMMLQNFAMRAQSIDQGGGAAAAPGAMASMMGGPSPGIMGQPAMAPVPGMGGDPNAMGAGAPPAQGAQSAPPAQGAAPPAQGDPNAQGAAPPTQGDPNAQGAAPPGQDPNAPPPQPVMDKEPNPSLFDQQVAPQFLDQAMQMNSDGVFDASAVASLANVRSIKDLLQNYTPALDNALDRLGRTLLLLYVKSSQVRSRIGVEAYTSLEESVRDTFRMLGDTLLQLDQYGNQMLPGPAVTA